MMKMEPFLLGVCLCVLSTGWQIAGESCSVCYKIVLFSGRLAVSIGVGYNACILKLVTTVLIKCLT